MSPIGKPIDSEQSLIHWSAKKAESGGENPNPESPPQNNEGKVPTKDATTNFVPREPIYSFEQVVLPESVLTQFQVLESRIANHQLLYKEWELEKIDPQGKHVAFNLYGVPGTGKTMCVEAIAQSLGKTIIDVSYAEIESKYVGETGKNITAAFKAASDSDSLLFFDEADSILGRRMTNVTQAADHGVNVARAVMLKQLDGFDGIVAFATNLSKNFDNAFVRRIAQHIEVPLPEEKGRRHLWSKMISPKIPGRGAVDWDRLITKSDGFSGGDIKNAVVNGLARLASRLNPIGRHVTNNTSEREVDLTDIFIEEIDHIRRAKRNVGSSSGATVEEKVIDNWKPE